MSASVNRMNGLCAAGRGAWKPGFHPTRSATVETRFPRRPGADAGPHASFNRTTRSAWKPGFHCNGGPNGQHA